MTMTTIRPTAAAPEPPRWLNLYAAIDEQQCGEFQALAEEVEAYTAQFRDLAIRCFVAETRFEDLLKLVRLDLADEVEEQEPGLIDGLYAALGFYSGFKRFNEALYALQDHVAAAHDESTSSVPEWVGEARALAGLSDVGTTEEEDDE